VVCGALGDKKRQRALTLEALNGERELFGDRDPATLRSLGNLASVDQDLGELEQAEREYLECIRIGRELDETGGLLQALHNVGVLYLNAQRFDDAEPLLVEALEKRKARLGLANPDTLSTLDALAVLRERSGEVREAAELVHDLADGRSAFLGPTDPGTLE